MLNLRVPNNDQTAVFRATLHDKKTDKMLDHKSFFSDVTVTGDLDTAKNRAISVLLPWSNVRPSQWIENDDGFEITRGKYRVKLVFQKMVSV